MIDLGSLGGTNSNSSATAINVSGQVVGYYTANGVDHAFLWTPAAANGTKGSMIDLGTLGGAASAALGINTSGQVVGQADTAGGQHHAFLWQSGTGMMDLGTLGGTGSSAAGINDAGQICGTANLSGDTYQHAFLWTKGATDGVPTNPQMKDLGTLGGNNSSAWAINTSGQVAGQADTTSGQLNHFRAFRWTPSRQNGTTGKMKDLGALNPNFDGSVSAAYGINDSGVVVGTSGENPPFHAVYWPGGSLQDLNDLVPANSGFAGLGYATGINKGGEIVGYGEFPSQPLNHAFLLTPPTAAAAATSTNTVMLTAASPTPSLSAPGDAITPNPAPAPGLNRSPAPSLVGTTVGSSSAPPDNSTFPTTTMILTACDWLLTDSAGGGPSAAIDPRFAARHRHWQAL
jgi:probable HAF family extracellular repeat protein